MIIHPKFVFAHIQKTGGMFVKKCLCRLPDAKIIKDRHKPLCDVENIEDKYKFAVIRNPFDWYVSFWSDYRRSNHPAVISFMTDEMRTDFSTFMWNIHLRKDKPCDDYTENFENVNRLNIGVCTYNAILLICRSILWNEGTNISYDDVIDSMLVDRLLKFDNLNNEVIKMFDEDIFPLPDNERNELIKNKPFNITLHNDFNTYYNNELIDFVNRKDSILFKLMEILWA